MKQASNTLLNKGAKVFQFHNGSVESRFFLQKKERIYWLKDIKMCQFKKRNVVDA